MPVFMALFGNKCYFCPCERKTQNNMKTLLHIVVYIFILMGLSGCNSDVFVEDFQPSVSDVTLEGNGDSVTIRFKSSNWDLLRVYDYYDNSSLYYSVYDKDGNIEEILCTYDPETKSGSGFNERKPNGNIHFVEATTAIPATIPLFIISIIFFL